MKSKVESKSAVKPAKKAAKVAVAAGKPSPKKIAGDVTQVDLGYFDIKQNGYEVGKLVVSKYQAGAVVMPGTFIEFYFLYLEDKNGMKPFVAPSVNNNPSTMEFVWKANGPNKSFDAKAYQATLGISNKLISCTCVDQGSV
ncbi:MAG: hypothetical protein Q8Q09_04560 [Deltaproteobacteria bacterium]|nr:hypothetical protein [Deltaproteobacteria bacterium]